MCCNRRHATSAKSLASAAAQPALAAPRSAARLAYRAAWSARFVLALLAAAIPRLHADSPPQAVRHAASPPDQAALLVQRTIERLVVGDAFDAKLRQRIWAGGREVVGIGHYEQSGGSTGRFSLEMTIHDGDTRQSIRQISDGKLAWTRTQLGTSVSLRRVDLGRIDEVCREAMRGGPARSARPGGYASVLAVEEPAPPWLRIGGLVELVDQIAADYDLRVGKGTVDEQPVWILRGALNQRARKRIEEAGGSPESTALFPFEVRLAIAAVGDGSGFGVGLPIKMEFWSEPVDHPSDNIEGQSEPGQSTKRPQTGNGDAPRGRLISLLEIYAVRPIQPSPEERFRFKRDDPDVTFSNDTRRYLDRLAP